MEVDLKEMISEHKRLVRVLKSKKGINQELILQERELREYIKKYAKRNNSIFGDYPGWTHRSL